MSAFRDRQRAKSLSRDDPRLFDVRRTPPGPHGSLPLTDEMLRDWPSGDLFGLSQNAGMGWDAARTCSARSF